MKSIPLFALAALVFGGGGLATIAASAAPPAGPVDGAETFAQNCAACHQPQGQGIPGAFPALAKNAFVTGPADPVILTVLNGRGGMPSFRDELTDAQIAAVISHVRTSWGNKAKPITEADVARLRSGAKADAERPIPAH